MRDAIGDLDPRPRKETMRALEIKRARLWLTRGGYEFKKVCDYADLDPEAVMLSASALIKNHDLRFVMRRYRERVARFAA